MKTFFKKLFVGASVFCLLSAYHGSQEMIFPKFREERQRIIRFQRYQGVFNNVYKTFTGRIGMNNLGIPIGGLSGGTAFNFNDKKDKSYYISVYHTIIPPELNFKKLLAKKTIIYDVEDSLLEARVEEAFKDPDISILSTKKDKYKAVKTGIIKYEDLLIGEEAYVVGYPRSGFRTVRKTNISAVVFYENKHYVVLEGDGSNGLSGSPVFVNRNGFLKLAGIVRLRNPGKKLIYAIPVNDFENVLKKYL